MIKSVTWFIAIQYLHACYPIVVIKLEETSVKINIEQIIVEGVECQFQKMLYGKLR